MNSSQFKKEKFRKREFKRFCVLVGFSPTKINDIISNIDKFYRERIENKINKATGEFKTYQDGTIKKRIIQPSLKELKIIQNNIKSKILTPIPLLDCVHGGVKGRSNITNAKPHQGKKYRFTTDLRDFYPNITSKRIYDTFLSLKFSPHFAHWLTTLTTRKFTLPQGTPTSTHIANLVFHRTDQKLVKFCNQLGITYTRYVDDLTFSCQTDFRQCLDKILEIISKDGFKLNFRKTEYSGNQKITGIDVFLNRIDAPNSIIEKAQIELETNSDLKPLTNYRNQILKTNTRGK